MAECMLSGYKVLGSTQTQKKKKQMKITHKTEHCLQEIYFKYKEVN